MTTGEAGAGSAPISAAVARPEHGVVVVSVIGEIDLTTAEELNHVCGQALVPQPRSLRVDLSGVEFCDSTGLAALIGINSRCATEQVSLVFVPSPTIRRLAQRTGLTSILPLASS